ncbi:hypothetical protein FB451DRAFT_1299070 [Mycena latifolia]|nr:hypothetical protein FB451DRAFT_1299070 [Mycena latifolia]
MAMNVAIVDDRDADIQYASTWNDAGSAVEFNGTTKWSPLQGSTASFTFVGTSIIVYGTVGANSPETSLSFAVDGSIRGSYISPTGLPSAIHHAPLWTSPMITNGSHTLVITQQTAVQTGGVIFLDYIQYNTTSTDVGSYFFDDRDPRILYTPPWRPFGSDADFQHTSQESSAPGDSFSLEFEGTSISYYGGLTSSDDGLLIASIVLDGGSPMPFTAPSNPPAPQNNLIFTSGTLAPGNHSLVVTSESTATIWTDYFLVTPDTGTSAPSSVSSPSGTLSNNAVPVGAIVGGILSGAVIIALVALAIFLYKRRRRGQTQETEAPRMGNVLVPRPFSTIFAGSQNSLSSDSDTAHRTANPDPESTPYPSGDVTHSRAVPIPRKLALEKARRQTITSETTAGSSLDGDDVPPGYSE